MEGETTLCPVVNTWREHLTLVWEESEDASGGRLIERLEEALKITAEVESKQISSE